MVNETRLYQVRHNGDDYTVYETTTDLHYGTTVGKAYTLVDCEGGVVFRCEEPFGPVLAVNLLYALAEQFRSGREVGKIEKAREVRAALGVPDQPPSRMTKLDWEAV